MAVAERREGENAVCKRDGEARTAQAERLAHRGAGEHRAAERDAFHIAAFKAAGVGEPAGRVVRVLHVGKGLAHRVRRHGGACLVAVVQHVGGAGDGLQIGVALLAPHVFVGLRAPGGDRKKGRLDRCPVVQKLLPGNLGADRVEPGLRFVPALPVERGEVVIRHIDLLFRAVAGEIRVASGVLQAARTVERINRNGLCFQGLVGRVERHLAGQRAAQKVRVRHGEHLRPRFVVDAKRGSAVRFGGGRRGGGRRRRGLRRLRGGQPKHERAEAQQQV